MKRLKLTIDCPHMNAFICKIVSESTQFDKAKIISEICMLWFYKPEKYFLAGL